MAGADSDTFWLLYVVDGARCKFVPGPDHSNVDRLARQSDQARWQDICQRAPAAQLRAERAARRVPRSPYQHSATSTMR